uniref:Ground-like domain-containing protein n=1 Tax=Bursaphelenchus xylophilus TaxID=6326 RepID=A0A1I7ST75_BURXY
MPPKDKLGTLHLATGMGLQKNGAAEAKEAGNSKARRSPSLMSQRIAGKKPSGCPDCAVRRKPRKRIKKRPKRTIKRFKPTVDNEQPRIDDYDFDERPLAELDYHKSQDDDTCNSEKIRNIIKRETGTKTLTLKRNIQTLVEEELEDQFNVVCGKGQFSYITTTDEFCQETIDDTTCYVFKRNKIDDS